MIMHIVLVKWNADATEESTLGLGSALDAFVATLAQVREYRHGSDLGLRPNTADYAIVAAFDDESDLRTYSDHPEHREIVANWLVPFAESISVAQIGA